MDGATAEQIIVRAEEFLRRPLAEAFSEHFRTELPAVVCQNHRILLVAPRLDAAAERIINYLAERHGVNINAVFFKYSKLAGGNEILARSFLVADETGDKQKRDGFTQAKLLAMAAERKTSAPVEICRQMNDLWEEQPVQSFGGSFRYWAETPSGKWRMVYGLNVSGERMKPPPGHLDVWIPTKSLSELTLLAEVVIRQTLREKHPLLEAQTVDCVLRLKTTEEARRLVEQLRAWATAGTRLDRSS